MPSWAKPKLVPIPVSGLQKVRPLVEPLLEKAVARGDGTLKADDIFRLAACGEMQLWVIWDHQEREILAAIVSQLIEYPSAKACRVILAAGKDMMRWTFRLQDMEAWAIHEGCGIFEIHGRKGWGRIFPDYREAYRVFTKELHHDRKRRSCSEIEDHAVAWPG